MEALRAHFKPEFLNRVDEMIVFHQLGREHIGRIVEIQLERVQQAARGAAHRARGHATRRRRLLAEKGYDPHYGARPLKRVIQRMVQDPLAMKILEGEFPEGSKMRRRRAALGRGARVPQGLARLTPLACGSLRAALARWTRGLAGPHPPLQSPPVSFDKTPSAQPHAEATRHVLREREGSAVFAVALGSSLLPPFVSPRGLMRCVAVGLVLFVLVSWVAVGVELAHLRQIHLQLAGAAIGALSLSQVGDHAPDHAQGADSAIFAVTALVFVAWLYRLRINLRALGVRKPEYARYWAVLGFLVPAINFVVPYQVISEVWRASDPAVLDRFEWKTVETPRLADALVGQRRDRGHPRAGGVRPQRDGRGDRLQVAGRERRRRRSPHAAAAVSASLAFFVVTRLTAAQIAKYELLRDDDVGA